MGSTDEMLATVADTAENLAMRDAVENDLDLPDDADIAPEHREEYQALIEKVAPSCLQPCCLMGLWWRLATLLSDGAVVAACNLAG
jgi:hypothetical protein